jgi:hypothetical protein
MGQLCEALLELGALSLVFHPEIRVKVVQELMRHGSARTTVDIYSQARSPAKRAAQQRLVQMILTEERSEPAIPFLESGSPPCFHWC